METAMPAQILLADDHAMVRQAVKAVLEEKGFQVVGEAGNGLQAIRLAERLQPDVVILDLVMPQLNGLAAVPEILNVSPLSKPIILTMYGDERYVTQAFKAGIKGYILKSQPADDLCQGICMVLRGEIYVSPDIFRSLLTAFLATFDTAPDLLTSRERQVLQLVADGKTTKEIADLLGMSLKTAESYRLKLMTKLNAHRTAHLVRYAVRQGLIHP